jgi:hypothetical protein
MLKALLVALVWLGALPALAAPLGCPGDDREVLERLPVRARDPAGSELRALRAAALASPADPTAAAWMVERVFDLKLL